MYTTVFDKPKNIERILEMINNQADSLDYPYEKEVKHILFGLINYYTGNSALPEIEYLNNEVKTFENKAELNEKLNGKNKLDAEQLIKYLVREFNSYAIVCDYWKKEKVNGKDAWVNTGLYTIDIKEYDVANFEKLKEIYERNLKEDLKTYDKLTKAKEKESRKIIINSDTEKVLKIINNEAPDNCESKEKKEVKRVLFELINYYSGNSALKEIRDINHEIETLERSKEVNEKMNGQNKPNVKQFLDLLVKTFNTYFTAKDNYVDTSHHGSPEWEKTGSFDISFKSEFPTVIFDKLKKLYAKNLEQDKKTFDKLTRNKKKEMQQKELKESKTTKQIVDEFDILDEELSF